MNIYAQVDFLTNLRNRFDLELNYERILLGHYMRFLDPGAVVFDVGANEGVHTEMFLKLTGNEGQVVAFEPIPKMSDILKERFAKQKNFTLHQVALSDHEGTDNFVFAEGLPTESGLRERKFSAPAAAHPTSIQVKVGRLDSYAKSFSRLDYLKLDIEGGGNRLFKGRTPDYRQ